jgi:Alkylmercury lyase
VLKPATNELRMANPFSAVPTAYRVHAAGQWWYGNCAWDALGICAALRTDGRVETSRQPGRWCGIGILAQSRSGTIITRVPAAG